MEQSETVQETTVENEPEHTVKHTTTHTAPEVRGEPPQRVYEKKKTIFRANQIVWYIAGVVDILLLFRFVLKAVGASPYAIFTNFVYSVTNVLIAPFQGILGVTQAGNSLIEWSTIIAGIVYLCIAWAVAYLLDIMYPITPKDVAVR